MGRMRLCTAEMLCTEVWRSLKSISSFGQITLKFTDFSVKFPEKSESNAPYPHTGLGLQPLSKLHPHLLTHSEIVHSCIRLYSNWFEFDHSAFGSHWRRSCWWVRQIKSPQLAFGRITDIWLLTAFCDVVQDIKAGRDSSLVQSTHVVYNRAVVHQPIAVKHLVINNAYPKNRTYAQARIVLRRSLK